MIQLDVTIVNVALPTIQRQLAASPGALEWIISGYALSLAALIPAMGALGDRLGHRPILLAGLVIFGFSSAGAALAPNPDLLVTARVGQGIGGAAMLALTLAVLTDTYPPEQRSHAIGWWAAIGGTGFGAGPIVGGVLLAYCDWPTIFWVNVPVIAVTICLILFAIARAPEAAQPTPPARPLDALGITLASLGLASVTFGLVTATETPWHPGHTLVPLTIGGCLVVAFVQWQRHATHPLVPAVVRQNRAFLGACAIYFTSYMAFSGTLYYVTLLYQNLKGWSALETGISWLLMNVPFLAAAQFAGYLHQRFKPRRLVATGCLAATAGVSVLATLTHASPFAVAALGYILAGVGFGLLVPGITHVAMRDVPCQTSGAASAVLNSSRQLGTATGLATIGAIGATVTRHAWTPSPSGHTDVDTADLTVGHLGSLAPHLRDAAASAFGSGYHAALATCVVSLLAASWLSLQALTPRERALEVASREKVR